MSKRSRAASNERLASPPRPPLQRSRHERVAGRLEALPDEIYPVIFGSLSTRSLLRLARANQAMNSKVHDYLGYRHHVVVNPSAAAGLFMPVPSKEQEPSNPPPSYTPQGSAQMHGKVYVPMLSTDPKCFVLSLDTFQWESFPITVMPGGPWDLADEPIGPATKKAWGPLTASVTACPSTCSLYVYGGVRKPIAQDYPFPQPESVGSGGTFGSGGSATTPLTPNESVDGDTTLRLSSDLFRLDIPFSFAQRQAGDDDVWRLRFLGSAAHPRPVTALRQAEPPSDTSYSPASSPLFNLHLDAPSPMADIIRNAEQFANSTTSSSSTVPASEQSMHISTVATAASSVSSVEEERKYEWPEARREHSLDCIRDEWLVMIGGRSRRGEEHSDAWAYELASGIWTPIRAHALRSQYSHSSAVIGDQLYVFGGCRTDSPLIIHDALSRMTCLGPPTEWTWINYASPALFEARKKRKKQGLASVDEDQTMEGNDSHPDASVTVKRRARSSNESSGSSVAAAAHSAGRLHPEHEDGGCSTTGQSPLERFSAALVPLGSRRLAVVGGLTVEEGVEPSSGVVFDEFCASHISAIDIFDLERLHWTSLRPTASLSGGGVPPHADYLLDSIAVALPPSHDNASWSMVVAGRALDLDEYEVSGDDFGLAAASARNSIARGDDGGPLNNWLNLRSGDDNPAQLRMDPQELLELHLRRIREDEMASESSRTSGGETAVRYYERDGVVCLASTFSRRTSVNRLASSENRLNQPIGGKTGSDAPAANYPTGVFTTDSGSSDGDRSGRAHVGTRQVLRVINFS